jgi:hypothetical protein
LVRALHAAEKLVFWVCRGFIPGINVVILVAFKALRYGFSQEQMGRAYLRA